MRRRLSAPLSFVAAGAFGLVGAVRLVSDGDLQAFAHLTVAAGLLLLGLRERDGEATRRLWYVPEFLLLLAILQYAYHFLGV